MELEIGIAVKVLHEGQRVYAIVQGFDKVEKLIRVRYPAWDKETAGLTIFESEKMAAEVRTTTTYDQRHIIFELLRQLVGIRLKKKEVVKLGAFTAPADEPDGGSVDSLEEPGA